MENKKQFAKSRTSATTIVFLLTVVVALIFTGCSSVFSAGISGKIVDSESTSNPKTGIQDVEVFVYTKEKVRDADFDEYTDSSIRFSPSSSKYYIGHATTNSSGEFTISKVVWEDYFPTFGKTADYAEVFLLFYHENFGLVKNDNRAMVMSDATANSVYQEMTKIRTTTVINLTIKNVANENLVADTVIAKISVPQSPQSTENKVYTETLTTGSLSIPVSYPRYSSGTTENKPTISISLEQNGNNQKFKQCKNGGTSGTDFAFTTEALPAQISGDSCPIETYMKAYKIAVPSVTGTYGDRTKDESDGKSIYFYVGGTEETNYRGKATTTDATSGDSGYERHGYFSLDSNGYWEDTEYEGKTASTTIKFYIDGDSSSGTPLTSSISTITSADTNINVTLSN